MQPRCVQTAESTWRLPAASRATASESSPRSSTTPSPGATSGMLLRAGTERCARIGERGRVDLLARADQLLDRLADARRVVARPGEDTAVLQPERDEALLVAADDDLVPFAREAPVLERRVELVGEEVRERVVVVVASEHAPRRERAVVVRDRPVLDPDPLAEERMLDRGDVACGPDVLVRRAKPRVDVDPIRDERARPARPARPAGRRRSPRRPRPRRASGRRRGAPARPSRSPRAPRRLRPRRARRPFASWSRAKMPPISVPSTRSSGTSSGKTMATSQPRERAVAATSAPIQPPPMTTNRAPLVDALADRVRVADAP